MGLSLSIQGFNVQVNFYVLPEATCQAILGVQWLVTLGPILTDYKELNMTSHNLVRLMYYEG
jgi:hypothetical protein